MTKNRQKALKKLTLNLFFPNDTTPLLFLRTVLDKIIKAVWVGKKIKEDARILLDCLDGACFIIRESSSTMYLTETKEGKFEWTYDERRVFTFASDKEAQHVLKLMDKSVKATIIYSLEENNV